MSFGPCPLVLVLWSWFFGPGLKAIRACMVLRKARLTDTQRMLITLRMNSSEEEKVFGAMRRELQSIQRGVGKRDLEGTNDAKKSENLQSIMRMANVERVDKEGHVT